jgi:hypothetical protein
MITVPPWRDPIPGEHCLVVSPRAAATAYAYQLRRTSHVCPSWGWGTSPTPPGPPFPSLQP